MALMCVSRVISKKTFAARRQHGQQRSPLGMRPQGQTHATSAATVMPNLNTQVGKSMSSMYVVCNQATRLASQCRIASDAWYGCVVFHLHSTESAMLWSLSRRDPCIRAPSSPPSQKAIAPPPTPPPPPPPTNPTPNPPLRTLHNST